MVDFIEWLQQSIDLSLVETTYLFERTDGLVGPATSVVVCALSTLYKATLPQRMEQMMLDSVGAIFYRSKPLITPSQVEQSQHYVLFWIPNKLDFSRSSVSLKLDNLVLTLPSIRMCLI